MKRSPSSAAPQRGFVTLSVMVIILMITYACYRFTTTAVEQHRHAAARSDRLQLEFAADSAEALLLKVVAAPPAEAAAAPPNDRAAATPPVAERFAGVAVGGNPAAPRRAYFTVVSRRVAREGGLELQYGPACTSAQLSLSAVAEWERNQAGVGAAALAALPGLDPLVAERIAQFLAGGATIPSAPRTAVAPAGAPQTAAVAAPAGGASSREAPVRPTNPAATSGPVWRGVSVEELLAVPGVTHELLWGGDRNANGVVSSWEAAVSRDSPGEGRGGTTGGGAAPLGAYLTPYSAERNVNRWRQPRVYLNQPDLAALEAALGPRLPRPWVEFIMAYRRYGPSAGSRAAHAAAARYAIDSIYDLIGAEVAIPLTEGKTQLLRSPCAADRSSLREHLLPLADEVTVDPRPVIPGRIDVNTAPREVLRTIPGADETLVERILGARETPLSAAGPQRYHAAWLAAEGWTEPAWMRILEPYVTAGGDVHAAQIAAFFAPGEADERRPVARGEDLGVRREVVLDAARELPCVVLRRDLSNLGLGYAREALIP